MTSLEDYLEFVAPDVIRIRGHRIGLEHIVGYYREGYTAEEVDAALARQRQQDERAYQQWAADPPPIVQRLRELHD